MEKKKCDQIGCENEAAFYVIMELRVNPNHPPALTTPILNVCKEHMDLEWKDVCDEEGWKKMCEGFKSIGRAEPTLEFSNIAILPL